MLSFLSPWFLLGAAAAAVPIVLHLLKREPEPRIQFPAVKLLKSAPVEYTETRRIREWLLLALRVAALVCLAVAFARPFFASDAAMASTGVTMIALDTSYSMSARETFERARRLARAAVNRVPAGDLVGVVTFADAPDIAAVPSADRALALAAIDRAAPGFGATRYRGALSAAVQAFGGRHGTVVMVTDLQETGWDAGDRVGIPESTRIEVADVGPPPPNLALTALRFDADHIVASVRNTGGAARETRAHLVLDGRAAGDADVKVAAGGSANVSFASTAMASRASVTIDDRDGVQADNVRYLVRGAARASVLIVTGSGELERDAFYVQQALASSGSQSAGFLLTGATPGSLAGIESARLSSASAVVLLSSRGLERRGRQALAAYVKGGGGLLIAVGPDVDGDVIADVLGEHTPLRIVTSPATQPAQHERSLVPTDIRHPVFQVFGDAVTGLGLARFRTIARVGGTGCQAIARFTSGETALLDCSPGESGEAGEGRALVLATDLDNRWNDFPLHATFVPFVHEAIRFLASGRRPEEEYLVGSVPPGIPPTPGIVPAPPAPSGSRTGQVAVNVDPRESDPARISSEDFQAAVTRLKETGVSEARIETRQQEDRQHIWAYVLALMCGVLAIEGIVASRTA
jgi:hypothetical protein